MLCKWCGIKEASRGDFCPECIKLMNETVARIDSLVAQGHTYHCACRQVWGDGECCCDLEQRYDPYWWMKLGQMVPFTTA